MTKYKVLFILMFIGCSATWLNAQKSVRIGYIDTEYILENIPDYQEATQQLDQKISKWKLEAETRLKEIEQKKKQLENESALLTRELYDEKMEEISFEESEVLNFQEKRFGPNGDVMLQKKQLMQPIQDQIYAAVQEIAERRKYDFIFDKNSDFLMLYSAERYDISDLIIRTITRADRRKQADTFDERKALREEEALDERSFEELERENEISSQQARRDSLLAGRRAEREAQLADRKRVQDSIREARRQATEARREKAMEERSSTKESNVIPDSTTVDPANVAKTSAAATQSGKASAESKSAGDTKTDSAGTKQKTAAEIQEEQRQQKLKEREERRKALEERKQKILEQRQKAREERERRAREADSIAKARKEENK